MSILKQFKYLFYIRSHAERIKGLILSKDDKNIYVFYNHNGRTVVRPATIVKTALYKHNSVVNVYLLNDKVYLCGTA